MARGLRRLIEASPQLARHVPGGNWMTEDAIALDSTTVVAVGAAAFHPTLVRARVR